MKDYLFLSEKDDFEAHNHYLKLILALLLLICGFPLSPQICASPLSSPSFLHFLPQFFKPLTVALHI